jgi:RNA polymerase sigma-70 factor (ECF subfamily)
MIRMKYRQRRTSMPSDAELARAAQRGDSVSLGILLERHRAPLYALAFRMLGHGPQAQDAVQETFLIALRRIDGLREPEAVGGWLRTILRNTCLTQLREWQGEVPFGEPPGRLENVPFESSTEETIDRLAMRDWVWTTLLELPEVLRVTAMLRYFGSYASYEEIAAILGVPVGTVSSRLTQVKIKLAEALLKTAELEHDEARVLRESQAYYFAEVAEEYNRGGGFEMLADVFSDDFAWAYPDGTVRRGRMFLDGFKEDVEAGVRLLLTNVLASKDVTVMEGRFENPHVDPFHCPPATSVVYVYRDGRIRLVRQYYALRSEVRPNEPQESTST